MQRLSTAPRLAQQYVHLIAICGILLAGCGYNSHEAELREAFTNYLTVLSDAQVTRDTSHLSEVAVSPRLEAAISGVEARKKFTEIASEEFEVASVKVLSYTDSEATIEVKWNYRAYTQSLAGGERKYGPTDRWYWRIVRVTLVKDGDTWKVKEIEFVDWSG